MKHLSKRSRYSGNYLSQAESGGGEGVRRKQSGFTLATMT